MNTNLGRLEKLSLRTVWEKEAGHFTPWLTLPKNLKLLGKTLGLELEIQGMEQYVGSYRADILCKDTLNGQNVLIENQLERTDHSHLGQLLTYVAGLNTKTIVWVAERFTDEHRVALDWLNVVTNTDIRFFGVEVEVWRIDHSLPAPKFNIVSGPNVWTKQTGVRPKGNRAPTQQLQLEYWHQFAILASTKTEFQGTLKPKAQDYMFFPIGNPIFQLVVWTHGDKDNKIGVSLRIETPNHKEIANNLMREAQHQLAISYPIEVELQNKKTYLATYLTPAPLADKKDWVRQHLWLAEVLERFYHYFAPRLKDFNMDVSNDEG